MLGPIILSMALALAAASNTDKKPAKPAKAPAATQPADDAKYETLDNGRIQYIPPEGWTKSESNSTPTRAYFASDTREGAILIEAPPDMKINERTANVIVKELRAKRKKAGTSVLDAKIEPDDRFDIRIREQFKQAGRVSEQLHLYKQVGSRVVMATINSVSDDEETTKSIQSIGEATLASAKFVKAPKRPPAAARPSTGAKRRP